MRAFARLLILLGIGLLVYSVLGYQVIEGRTPMLFYRQDERLGIACGVVLLALGIMIYPRRHGSAAPEAQKAVVLADAADGSRASAAKGLPGGTWLLLILLAGPVALLAYVWATSSRPTPSGLRQGAAEQPVKTAEDRARGETAREATQPRPMPPLTVELLDSLDAPPPPVASRPGPFPLSRLLAASRPLNGAEVVMQAGPRGLGSVKVRNGTSEDAFVALVDATTLQDRRGVYLWARSEAVIQEIAPGTYLLQFASGAEWDADSLEFRRSTAWSEFVEPLRFAEVDSDGGVRYSTYELSLHAVVGGTARVKTIDRDRFRRGERSVLK